MSATRTIAAIGVSDEEVAHLRLLMRKAAGQLADTWQWGSDEMADLIVVEPRQFAGQMARSRARASGCRCAVLLDPGEDAADVDLVLCRPLRLASVVNALEQVSRSARGGLELVPLVDDAIVGDHATGLDSGLLLPDDAVAPSFAGAAPGLDDVLREQIPERPPGWGVPAIDESVTIASIIPTVSHRSEVRRSDAPPPPPARPSASPDDSERLPLRAFLAERGLGGPARIRFGDGLVLALDPKHRVFHTAASLGQLAPHLRENLRRGDWHPLTTAELTALREREPAQPYERLTWLDVLLGSGGRLAAHLDPGGTYRLTRWMELGRDLPRQTRIAASMLQPQRLHEIAAASDAPMDDVFDLVNAYDAIGWLEWSRRTPRLRDDAPAEKGGLTGLMQRLRKPFGER